MLHEKSTKECSQNGQDVAVRSIINNEQMDTFVREVMSLSKVQHPNLVVLLGYYENKLCYN